MKKEILVIEFTGKQELEVYDRFEREVDDEWDKLQIQIPKSRSLGSRKDIEKRIIIRVLDRYLTPLPPKESLEREVGQPITNKDWGKLKQMDKEHDLNELRRMCKEKDLRSSGDKKTLAWRLLNLGGGNLK